jgi:hypothetical protein
MDRFREFVLDTSGRIRSVVIAVLFTSAVFAGVATSTEIAANPIGALRPDRVARFQFRLKLSALTALSAPSYSFSQPPMHSSRIRLGSIRRKEVT